MGRASALFTVARWGLAALLVQTCPAEAQTTQPTSLRTAADDASLDEVSRQLDNPLTDLWSLTLEDSVLINKGNTIDGRTVSNVLFFQPGLPIPLPRDMVFIARPAFPLVTAPLLNATEPSGYSGHKTGFGDMQMLALVGPNKSAGLVWGVGGTFKFPTATSSALGAEKWQAGPAAMVFGMLRPWTIGVLVEHWWSYAGNSERANKNQTDLKYIARYNLPGAWSVGLGPTITMDWEADSGDRWTVPVGLGVTKTVRIGKLPLKFRAETHYSVVSPDSFGDEWKFLFRIAPVIPSPFRN